MVRYTSLLTISVALFTGATYGSYTSLIASSSTAATYEPIAVVELFTSQGCSSCPPADRLLGEWVDKAEQQDQPIYALSFHVAYWNYLGWRDPFSREEFTNRQRQYARTLGESVYTPQMIVNGSSVFVGSKSATANREIASALQQPSTHQVALKAEVVGQSVQVHFEVTGPTAGQVLHVALIERDLSVDVERGENGGRTLHHDNVVRQFDTITLANQPSSRIFLSLPEGINPKKASLIAYVQDAQSWAISGASRVALSTPR